MGIFSFIKNAGAKVFGVGKTTEEENADKATKLVAAVNALGLNVSDLSVEVEGETAKVWGEADSQPTKEKVVLAVGNTEGIGAVEDNLTIAVTEEAVEEVILAQFHTVEKGDTLGKIAKQYYGNAMKYPEIFEANKPMLSHPDKIYPGQLLRIPALVD